MKATDINRIINNYSPEESKKIFENYLAELKDYKKQQAKRGSFIHIKIIEDEAISITNDTIRRLCKYFLNEILSETEINFLVDNILASNANYDSNEVQELIEEFTDPEINGVLTPQYVKEILRRLNV